MGERASSDRQSCPTGCGRGEALATSKGPSLQARHVRAPSRAFSDARRTRPHAGARPAGYYPDSTDRSDIGRIHRRAWLCQGSKPQGSVLTGRDAVIRLIDEDVVTGKYFRDFDEAEANPQAYETAIVARLMVVSGELVSARPGD